MNVPKWFERLMNRWKSKDCYKIAFRIAAMGQENGNAQTFLNAAKDNLYRAGHELDPAKDNPWK